MKLYIGGAYQGKRAFVLRQVFCEPNHICDGEICEKEEIFHSSVIDHFHCYIKRFLKSEEEIEEFLTRLLNENEDCCIICNEVGCGVVPTDKKEREYRELVGRVMIQTAQRAVEVTRIFCGIGVRIK